ncbi:MAG: histidine phosphatase family protein [Oscillospiraceae bacterium]|nr:histidine phosphatase family protein [Oscillospiraceae bacterium]
MKILIIRHGDPDYSIDSLTEKGWREAEYLSEKLKDIPAAGYYLSPLGRAKDTASLTLKKVGKEGEVFPWLREFQTTVTRPDRTESQDYPWDWLPADWAEEDIFYTDRWFDHPVMAKGNAGANYRHVCGELDKLIARHGYVREGRLYKAVKPNSDTIMLFCHFGLECVLLSHLLNISPMVLWHGSCAAPSSVTTLVTEERREGTALFRMTGFGDVSHLYARGEMPSPSARFCECYGNEEERHD